MSPAAYFVRVRGRVTGPHDLEDIQRMIRRGVLTRIHEISADRETWAPAGTLEHLFVPDRPSGGHKPPAPVTEADRAGVSVPAAQPRAADDQDRPAPEPEVIRAPPPMQPPGEESFCYSQNGQAIGPVSLQLLRRLAASGRLAPDDPVWPEGGRVLLPAREMDVLAPIYAAGGGPSSATAPMRPELLPVLEPALPAGGTSQIVRQLGRLSVAAGLSAAALLLFCVNVPHKKIDDKLIWWWGLLNEPGMGVVVFLCFYAMLTGLGLVFVALLLRGAVRGWVYVGAAVAGMPLLVATGMSVGNGNSLFLALAGPLFFVALIAVSYCRLRGLPEPLGKMIQMIVGGLACVVTLALGVLSTLALMDLKTDATLTQGCLIFSLVVSALAYLAAVAGGILAIVGALRAPTKRMASGIIWPEAAASALLLIAGAAVGYGIVDSLPAAPGQGRFAFVQVLRLLVVAAVLSVLLVTGLLELLTCTDWRRSDSPQYQGPFHEEQPQ